MELENLENHLIKIWSNVFRHNVTVLDDFFKLNGDSIHAVEIILGVEEHFKITLEFDVIYEASSIQKMAKLLKQELEKKSHTIHLNQTRRIIDKIDRNNPLALSFAQQRLWFLDQLNHIGSAYNMSVFLRLQGQLNLEALIQSLQSIVSYHEPLRTLFKNEAGQGYQYILQDYKLTIPIIDLSHLADLGRTLEVEKLCKTEQETRFDLEKSPGFRVQIIILSNQEHLLLVTFHHIVSDGWSLQLFSKELSARYNGLVKGESVFYKELSVHYADFAVWQREYLTGEVLDKQLQYWLDKLHDAPELQLPTDFKRPLIETFDGAMLPIKLSKELSYKLIRLAQKQRVTQYILLLATYQTLLHRYTGQDKIVVGSPIANRTLSELEGLIGFFVNSLVMCTDVSGNPSFLELLERVKETALGAYEHQDLPFERLVAEINPERNLNRNPLFQVVFALQQAEALYPTYDLQGLEVNKLQLNKISTRCDIELHLCERHNQIEGYCVFNVDLFKKETIERMLTHFEVLLEGIVANPEYPLSKLPIMLEAEKQQILVDWNNTRSPYPQDKTLYQLFEAQVERTPNHIAVVFEDETLTYRELNQKANQLARYIRDFYQEVKDEALTADTLIGLCVEKSIESIVAILAIIKAGAAYVPIDSSNPQERIDYILKDCNSAFILTQSTLEIDFQIPSVLLDTLNLTEYNNDNLSLFSKGNDLAYVIYTSGTTGKPKGVMIEHRSVVSLFFSMNQIQISSTDTFLQISNLAFDISIFEIFGSLLNGSKLIIPEKNQIFLENISKFHTFLNRYNISVLIFSNSIFEQFYFLDKNLFKNIKYLLIGGEPLSPHIIKEICHAKEHNQTILNCYGPTESCIFTTMYHCDESLNKTVPIGYPIGNRIIYNLDKNLCLVPVGVAGELYISGPGLARGYLNQPELTGECFISNPFISSEETMYSRLYKTGDLASLREDGNLEYIGRTDLQVKLRGYRIECGEIEVELKKCPQVKDAVVGLVGEEDKKLAAWLVLNQKLNEEQQLKEHITSWQKIFDHNVYADLNATNFDPLFNTSGWLSSYDGSAISETEMRVWANDIVSQILELKPQNVLEIGYGTGMLAFAIAPHCGSYFGTDISENSLSYVREQISTHAKYSHMKLRQQEADDFSGFSEGQFDCIILNSVVQYFPNIQYLLKVIEGCLRILKKGGFIFFGDIRNYAHMKLFHTSVARHQLDENTPVSQLIKEIEKRIAKETELFIDPQFFYAVANQFDEVHHAHIRLQRGDGENELAQFRYHALLQLTGGEDGVIAVDEVIDAKELNLISLTEKVHSSHANLLHLKNIANARVFAELSAMFDLNQFKDISKLNSNIKHRKELGNYIHPEEIIVLGQNYGYRVEITWPIENVSGYFDAYLIKEKVYAKSYIPNINLSIETHSDWSNFSNIPFENTGANTLLQELKGHLEKYLPDYMIPSLFIPIGAIPLTSNGKIDRKALPDPILNRDMLANEYCPPSTPMEKKLVEIWQEILMLDQGMIGINDNFFELGGHSLLAMQLFTKIHAQFNTQLPLEIVYQISTLKEMANQIETISKNSLAVVNENKIFSNLDFGKLLSIAASSKIKPIKPGSLLVEMNGKGTKCPIFWCCNDYNRHSFLGKYLGEDQPIYLMYTGFRALDLKSSGTLNTIARYYVNEILQLKPYGPYCIGGYCLGGKLAIEIASILIFKGYKISYLLLSEYFDSGLFDYPGSMLLTFAKKSRVTMLERVKSDMDGWKKQFQVSPLVELIPGDHLIFHSRNSILYLSKTITKSLAKQR